MQPVMDGKDRDQGPGGRVPRQWRTPQKRSPSGERHARAGEERRTKGGRGWRIPVMEKIDLHPEKENQQGKKKKGPHGCSP